MRGAFVWEGGERHLDHTALAIVHLVNSDDNERFTTFIRFQ